MNRYRRFLFLSVVTLVTGFRLQTIAASEPPVEMPNLHQDSNARIRELDRRIQSLQSQLNVARGEFKPNSPQIRNLEKQLSDARKARAFLKAQDASRDDIKNLESQIRILKTQRSRELARYRANSPRVKTLNAQIQRLEKELRQSRLRKAQPQGPYQLLDLV